MYIVHNSSLCFIYLDIKTKTDEDGTEYEWDEDKKAWFPKVSKHLCLIIFFHDQCFNTSSHQI